MHDTTRWQPHASTIGRSGRSTPRGESAGIKFEVRQHRPNARRIALRGARVRPDGVVVDAASHLATAGGVDLDLTRREFDLLHLTAHPGRVYTRDGLMREVWGYAVAGYPAGRTVDVHVARLRRKLGVHATRLETIRGVGYRWRR